MKTVRILEEKIAIPSNGFDHVFSFPSNPADSFPHHYINQRDFDSVYDELYTKLCHVLEQNPFKTMFSHEGVYLLWCLKKELFFYIFSMVMRHETFKRVLNRNQDSKFLITNAQDSHQVSLANVVKESRLDNHSRISFADNSLLAKLSDQLPEPKKLFWPGVFSFGDLAHSQIATFADYERSKSVLVRLKDRKPALFLNNPSPRVIFNALKNGFPFYQSSFSSKAWRTYQQKAEVFSALLSNNRVFENFKIREVNCEPLLNWKMNDLFVSQLPKLLFEIDQMNQFFMRAKSLKSALLDEDVDVSQNAFCQVARKFGVVTFVELHGALGEKHGFMPFTADNMFVWGNAQKEKLIGWGCNGERILVSGCSRYSAFQKMDSSDAKKKVAKDLGFDPNEKMVVLAFMPVSRWYQYFEEHMKQTISETLRVISEFTDQARFVIKLHPADENIDFYRACIKQNKIEDRILMVQKYNPLLLAKASDFLIIYRSTYAVDGFALDKPVICLYDEDDDLICEYRKFSVFQYSNDKSMLRQMCQNLLAKPFVRPDSWNLAKSECLNAGVDPDEFIAAQLLNVS